MNVSKKSDRLVIAFDAWTGGIRHFDRLQASMKRAGYTLKLYHIESWQPVEARPGLQSSSGIEVIDVGKYVGKDLLNLFREQRPVAVIFLWIDTFTERAINRYCLHIGIPTLWLNHGLNAVLSTIQGANLGISPIARIKYLLPRVRRLLFRVLPTYIAAMWISQASISEWARILTDLYALAVARYRTKNADDSRCSATAVYTDADIEQAISKYGHSAEEVVSVGNPDLTDFGLKSDQIGFFVDRNTSVSKEIVYIDTRLLHLGLAFLGEEDFFAHLQRVRSAVERQGYSLVLRLHPGHGGTAVPGVLRQMGFELLEFEDFCPRLLRAAAAIVEPSSVDVIPALMGLPVLLGKFNNLSVMEFGPILHSYPRGAELTNLEDIDSLVSRLWHFSDHAAMWKWIHFNSGPLPSEDFSDRVVRIIDDLQRKNDSRLATALPLSSSQAKPAASA